MQQTILNFYLKQKFETENSSLIVENLEFVSFLEAKVIVLYGIIIVYGFYNLDRRRYNEQRYIIAYFEVQICKQAYSKIWASTILRFSLIN